MTDSSHLSIQPDDGLISNPWAKQPRAGGAAEGSVVGEGGLTNSPPAIPPRADPPQSESVQASISHVSLSHRHATWVPQIYMWKPKPEVMVLGAGVCMR